jgi:hypothetical protein
MNTGYVFRATWPIIDLDRPMSVLKAEAAEQIDELAAESGCRILGTVTWKVVAELLIGQAAAVPTVAVSHAPRGAHGAVSSRIDIIRQLAGEAHLSDAQIARRLGCSEAAVTKARKRAKPPVPPGRGNPTLAGYQPRAVAA